MNKVYNVHTARGGFRFFLAGGPKIVGGTKKIKYLTIQLSFLARPPGFSAHPPTVGAKNPKGGGLYVGLDAPYATPPPLKPPLVT